MIPRPSDIGREVRWGGLTAHIVAYWTDPTYLLEFEDGSRMTCATHMVEPAD